ncbi:MAG: ABC transporter permease [Eisenbergiella sp.]
MEKVLKFSFNKALFLIWLVIFIESQSRVRRFDRAVYYQHVRNIVEIGMVALPMTLIIITGGIDLSVGNTMILSAMLGGIAYTKWGTAAAVAATLLTGAACGLLNGVIIAKAKISAMVTTLATMYLFLGLARGISKGDSVYSYSFAEFSYIDLGLPIQIWLFIILAVVFTLLGNFFGRKLYGIGLNINATKYSGVNTDRMLIIIYTLCGIVCAIAAFIFLGRFTSVKYDAGTSFNLKVITIVVLGGTSIMGGVGDMKGTILGTLIIATLNSGLTVMNIPIDVQTIVQGAVLIIALIACAIVTERTKKKRIIKVDSHEGTKADPA